MAAFAAPGAPKQIEQQPSPPHLAHIGLAAAVDRFLAVNLANVAVAIEPAPFKQDQERANVAAAILHDLNFGPRIAAPNRFDQPLATRNGRDDQIEGNRQAPERPGDVGPSVLVVDMGDDRDRRVRGTIRHLRRRS